ncbi:DUF2840 domain-containing protein [Paremcibacter congregatus]|uniref:DUF2840 domain-containing protein n=1 Tax=Paremcibacter congregatus TaxID=2043170 RepID=UPI003A947763
MTLVLLGKPRLTLVQVSTKKGAYGQALRFGRPYQVKTLGPTRTEYRFLPTSVFGYLRWQERSFGRTDRQYFILQAASAGEPIVRVRGVYPGVFLLLEARGALRVKRALNLIDALEAAGFAPETVSPDYYRHCHNRIKMREEIHAYTHAQHQAWLQKKRFQP